MSMRDAKVLAQVKESFMILCTQYEQMGKMLQVQAQQYHEMGQQMKTLGEGIDLLGGRSVMTGKDQIRMVSGTPNELKRQGYNVKGGK